MREGTAGLARRWHSLGTAEQRRTLLHEIAQFWDEWADEGTVELAIAALEEPDDMRGYALLCAKAAFQSNKTIPCPKELFWADKLDPDNLPYPYPANFPADLIKPGFRVSSLGTGLLDIEVLETALKRICARP